MIIQNQIVKNTDIVLNSVEDQIIACELYNVTFLTRVPVLYKRNMIVMEIEETLNLGRPYQNKDGLLEPHALIEGSKLITCKSLYGGYEQNYIERRRK